MAVRVCISQPVMSGRDPSLSQPPRLCRTAVVRTPSESLLHQVPSWAAGPSVPHQKLSLQQSGPCPATLRQGPGFEPPKGHLRSLGDLVGVGGGGEPC